MILPFWPRPIACVPVGRNNEDNEIKITPLLCWQRGYFLGGAK